MQPACGVDRGDRCGEPVEELDQLVIGQPAIARSQHRLEIVAVDPFQDDERAAVSSAGILAANDSGMIEPREKRRLTLEALAVRSELDEHPLGGGAIDRREAVRRLALASLQTIAVREQRAGRPDGVRAVGPIDRRKWSWPWRALRASSASAWYSRPPPAASCTAPAPR